MSNKEDDYFVVEVVVEDIAFNTEVEGTVTSIKSQSPQSQSNNGGKRCTSNKTKSCTVVTLEEAIKAPDVKSEEDTRVEMCTICLKNHPVSLLKDGYSLKGLHSHNPLCMVLVMTTQTTLKLPKSTWYVCSSCVELLQQADEYHVDLENLKSKMSLVKKTLLDSLRSKIKSESGEVITSPIHILKPVPLIKSTFNFTNNNNKVKNNQRNPTIIKKEVPPGSPPEMPVLKKLPPKLSININNRRRRRHSSNASSDDEDPTLGSSMFVDDKEKKITCPVCQKTTKRKYIKKHLKRVHVKKEAIICRGCVKKFPNEHAFTKHLLFKHEDGIKLGDVITIAERESALTFKRRRKLINMRKPCPICGVVLHRYYLTRHLRHHDKDFTVQCKLCSETFKRTHHRRLHMTEVHGFPKLKPKVKKPAACHICHKIYGTQGTLKRHLNTVHMIVKQMYKCHLCDKMFKGKYLLQSHMKVHTDEKPYMCKICMKNFKFLPSVRKHLRRIHQIEHFANDSLNEAEVPIVKLFERSKVKMNYTIVENVAENQN